jgi:predicted dehydrogenase
MLLRYTQEAKMKKYKVGIVGAGIMGDIHARVYRLNPLTELVAVCDINKEKAQSFAKNFNLTSVYDSYQLMFNECELDIVSVCTPDFAHSEPTIAATNKKIHVLVEKPLATDLQDSLDIITAAKNNHVKVMAQFSHRWVPAYRQAKDLIARKEAGSPVLAYTRKNDIISVPTEMIVSWVNQTNPSWFLSSHDIDLVCWYFDVEPVEVYASAVYKVLKAKGLETPDAIQAQVKFADGSLATFESCWIYPDTFPTMVDSWVQIVCENQVIQLDRKYEQLEIATPLKHEYPRNLLAYNFENNEVHGAVPLSINHFIRCVDEDLEPLVTLQSSLTVTRILDAIQKSIETDSRIKLG